MTIDELVDHYYDDLDGAITGVSGDTDALDVTFEYDESFQGEARVAAIRCTDVHECTLHPGGVAELSRPAEHPLLWQHVQPTQRLYFASAPANPFELLGRLYSVHHELFGEWRAPRDYVCATAEILTARSGQLAHGPERAIAAYRAAAEPFVRCSVTTAFQPKGSSRLLLFDESFVICSEIALTVATRKG